MGREPATEIKFLTLIVERAYEVIPRTYEPGPLHDWVLDVLPRIVEALAANATPDWVDGGGKIEEEVARIARALRPMALLVIETLGFRTGLQPGIADAQIGAAIGEAREFVVAIRPKRAMDIVRDPRFRERVDAFLRQKHLSDPQVTAYVSGVWASDAGLHAWEISRILSKIPVRRLRGLPEEDLLEIAKFFRDWDPLVDFIAGRTRSARLDVQFGELRARLVKRVARRGWDENEAEDAFSEAQLKVDQYSYEKEFPHWFSNQMLAYLRKRRQATEAYDDHWVGEADGAKSIDDLILYLQLLFQLVLPTFRRDLRERVKVVWEFMVLDDEDEEISDDEIAEEVASHVGDYVPPGTVQTYRRRLRQRMKAAEIVWEAKDVPPEKAVCEEVERRYGMWANDRPTIYAAACLARTAREDQTPAAAIWAAASWRLIRWNEPFEDVERLVKAYVPASTERASRLATAARWLAARHCQGQLSCLRSQATSAEKLFLAAPLWHFRVWLGAQAKAVVSAMDPVHAEWIEANYALLPAPAPLPSGGQP